MKRDVRVINNPCKGCMASIHDYSNRYRPSLEDTCFCCEKRYQYNLQLEKRRKYTRGDQIRTIQEFDYEINTVGFVYQNHKIQHAGWMISQPYRNIINGIKSGALYKVIKK